MAFDIDILIVFADADNIAVSESRVGWASQFKKFLEFMLVKVLGENPKILLKGEYDSMTSPKLDNVGVLIVVLSKNFAQSTACLEHVNAFYNATKSDPDHHRRIFKVFKSPMTSLEQPESLREMLGYEMYQLNSSAGEMQDYADYFNNASESQYWMEMVDLSYDIHDTLRELKNGSDNAVKELFTRKTVYLAETGRDLAVQRSILTRELQRNGYAVLPDKSLPVKFQEIEQTVRSHLNESIMSIHMIGNVYGEIPEGYDRSVVDIQHRLAAEKNQQAKENEELFSRLIWISPNLSHATERQKLFIENVKRDVETQEGAEILQTPLEDFKNIIREELNEAIDRKSRPERRGRSIYLMYESVDQGDVKPYLDIIEKSGFNVLIPAFEGEWLELRQKHIENLLAFDAAIIFKGSSNEQWVRMKALDLLKAPGFGRKKPISAKAIIASSSSTQHREVYKNQNLRIIEADPHYSLESLKSFLQELNA
jgi:hypothetical protein